MKQENRGPLQDHRHVCWSMFIAKLVLGDSNEKDGLHPVSPIELSLMPLEDVKNLSLELLWQLQVILNGGDSHDKAIEMVSRQCGVAVVVVVVVASYTLPSYFVLCLANKSSTEWQ